MFRGKSVDVISDILKTFRLNASVYHSAQHCGNWVMQGMQVNMASFHFVSKGNCFLHLPQASEPYCLQEGDFLLFPHSQSHKLSHYSQMPDESLPANGMLGDVLGFEQPALTESTGLVCGLLELQHARPNPLLKELPPVVIVRNDPQLNTWLLPLVQLLQQELVDQSPGGEAVVDKLADVLFVQVIRHYLAHQSPTQGVLAALAEPQLHRALELLHAEPGYAWTLEELAQQIGLSRSVLAARFKQVLGLSVMQYLTEWRMQQAYIWLREEQQSVLEVAERCGYQSDAAFSKAFKKVLGFGPGEARKGAIQKQS